MVRGKGLTVLFLVAALAAPAAGYEVMAPPEKGTPYAGDKQTLPYEDALDVADVILAGTAKTTGNGRFELAVTRVLRGKFEKKDAAVAYAGDFAEEPEAGKAVVLFCLEPAAGQLRLAADPPKGSGLALPGEKLVEKLLEAAKDPAKAYASADPAVKLSAAYRLARAWAAAPEGKKPALPAGLVETLIEGLAPGELRDRFVHSASRNALNLLLDADLNSNPACRYSVNDTEDGCKERAGFVRAAWEEALAAARKQAGVKPPEPPARPADEAERVRKLIAQLGADAWDRREEAQNALRALGKAIEKELEAGAASKDPEVSERCNQLLKAIRKPAGGDEPGPPRPAEPAFDLRRVRLVAGIAAGK